MNLAYHHVVPNAFVSEKAKYYLKLASGTGISLSCKLCLCIFSENTACPTVLL